MISYKINNLSLKVQLLNPSLGYKHQLFQPDCVYKFVVKKKVYHNKNSNSKVKKCLKILVPNFSTIDMIIGFLGKFDKQKGPFLADLFSILSVRVCIEIPYVCTVLVIIVFANNCHCL